MSYTHYWKLDKTVTQANYRKALTSIKKIVELKGDKGGMLDSLYNPLLANGWGQVNTLPEFEDGINFNGIGDDAHETFSLPKQFKDINYNSCKTDEKPYDIIVVACLAVLAEVKGVTVSSDGGKESWDSGSNLASMVLGRQVVNPL